MLSTPALLLVGLLVLSACGGSDESSPGGASDGFPMTVDNCGRMVTFEKRPERVMTQQDDPVTLLWAAGAADRIIARSNENQAPLGPAAQAVQDVEQIAPSGTLAKEAIIAQNPDLLISTSAQGESVPPEDLAAVGIDVLYVTGFCAQDLTGGASLFDQIYSDIELYGRLFGTEDTAARAVAEMRARVAAVKQQVQGAPKVPRAAALIFSGDTIGGYGNRGMAHEQMELLGFTNVFADVEKRYFEPSIEEILTRDPEVLILLTQRGQDPEQTKKQLLSRPELAGVTAIRNRAVSVMEFAYSAHGYLPVEGLEILARELGGFR